MRWTCAGPSRPRGVLAPNSFKVLLSTADRSKFQPIEEELVKELVQVANEHAKDEGYTFLGPLSVAIETDESLRPGTLLIAGEIAPGQGTATLTLPDGRRVVLDGEKVTLGRHPNASWRSPTRTPAAATPRSAVAPTARGW